MKGISSISSNKFKKAFKLAVLKFRSLEAKSREAQKSIVSFIKRHRTVKLIHLVRNYSALTVVISSAILVISTNLSAQGESKMILGQWISAKEDETLKPQAESQYSRKNNLALVPLSTTANTISTDFKEESDEMLTQAQGRIVMAPSSPVLRDPEEDGGVTIYTVKSGDTVSSIAQKHNITVNTILWANDLDNVDSIVPGDQIFILPVAGLTHVVTAGEDINMIAEKYKADKNKIIAFNELPANGEVKIGQEITIPGGQKEIERATVSETGINRRQYATPTGGEPKVSGWKKLEGKAGTGHQFPYGYCTWYVAQKRYVPWSGNAGTWLYKAKSMGYKTGKTPEVGAIMVSSESWWGHVAIVENVSKGMITVSEMNYRGWAKASKRTFPANSRVIKGYIY